MTAKPTKSDATDPLKTAALRASIPTTKNVSESILAVQNTNQSISDASKLTSHENMLLQEAKKQMSEFNKLNKTHSDTLKLIKPSTDLLKEAKQMSETIKQADEIRKLLEPNYDLNKLIKNFPHNGTTKYLPSKTTQTERVSIATPKQLGSLIKSSRTSKKLTQQQLADLAGVGRRFIVECEAGKPRLEFAKVLQVAAAAGIDIIAIKR
jgi:y4mF family transcriptional regulator